MCRLTPRRCSQPCGVRPWRSSGADPAEEVRARHRLLDLLEPVDRPGVEHLSPGLAGARADVDDPVGTAYDVEVVLDDEQRVARALERGRARRAAARRRRGAARPTARRARRRPRRAPSAAASRSAAAGPRRARAWSSCGRARGSRARGRAGPRPAPRGPRRGAPPPRCLPSRRDVAAGLGSSATGRRLEIDERERVGLGDAQPPEGHRERLGPQPGAVADRADGAADEAHRLVAHHLALGVGQRVAHVLARAPEGAVVVATGGVVGLAAPVDEHARLLVGVEQPVAVLAGQLAPRHVDVDADRLGHPQQVLALPGAGPGRDRTVADAQRRVGHEEVLGDVVRLPQPVTGRGTLRRRCSARTPRPPAARLPRGRCRPASRGSAPGWTAWSACRRSSASWARRAAAGGPRRAAAR